MVSRLSSWCAGLTAKIRAFGKALSDDAGATAIEYGLIAAGISIAIIGVVFTLGNEISGIFEVVQSKLSSVKPG